MFHKCWIVLRNGERPQLFANPDEMDDVWYIHMIFLVCVGLDVEVLCVDSGVLECVVFVEENSPISN